MVNILGDHNLEQIVCSQCHKYLSVFPVKIYKDRQVKCGRCNEENDGGERSSLYEVTAKNCLFKCINRYEGCRKLLQQENVKQHEQECQGSTFHCPKCENGIEMSALGMIWHYKFEHRFSIIKTNSFVFKVSQNNDALLYIQDDTIFFICYEYFPSIKTLYLTAITLTHTEYKQRFIVTADFYISKRTDVRSCKSLSSCKNYFDVILTDDADSFEIFFNLEMPSKSKNTYEIVQFLKTSEIRKDQDNASNEENVEKMSKPSTSNKDISCNKKIVTSLKLDIVTKESRLLTVDGQEINVTCSNCQCFIGKDIYRCQKMWHTFCVDCCFWCDICKCSCYSPFTYFAKEVEFPCIYCNHTFHDIKNHQIICEMNIKSCPICSTKMTISLFNLHMKFHDAASFSTKIDLVPHLKSNFNHYFLVNERLIHLKTSTLRGYTMCCFTFPDNEDNVQLCAIRNESLHILAEKDNQTNIHLMNINSSKLFLKFVK